MPLNERNTSMPDPCNNAIWIQSPPSIGFVLDVDLDNNNRIIVNPPNSSSATQLWFPMIFGAPNALPSYVFVNGSTGQALAAGKGVPILVPFSDPPANSALWNLSNYQGSPFYGFFAINIPGTVSSLNITGSGPYPAGTPVILWNFDSPATANEVWTFSQP